MFGWRLWGFCLLILVLVAGLLGNTVTVCVASNDSVESMSFTSGVRLYSPINKTYSTKFLTLNLTANVGIAINCTITYSIDNKHQGTVPLKQVYPGELHVINPVKGTATLPELTQGTHNLTLQVVCTLNNGQGSATMNTYPFIPECNNITTYHATWTDTIQFSIQTEQEIPEFSPLNLFTLTILATTIILLYRRYKPF